MKRAVFLASAVGLAFTSSLALAGGPEDLLPPIFRDPPPQQQPSPTPTPTPSQPVRPAQPSTPSPSGSGEIVQPLPGSGGTSLILGPGYPA